MIPLKKSLAKTHALRVYSFQRHGAARPKEAKMETNRVIQGPVDRHGLFRLESPIELDGETFMLTEAFFQGRYDFTFATKLVDGDRVTLSVEAERSIVEAVAR